MSYFALAILNLYCIDKLIREGKFCTKKYRNEDFISFHDT